MAKTKEEVITLMTNKFQEGNRELCRQFGMSEEDILEKVDQANQTIEFLMLNVYDSLDSENLINL